MFRSIPPLQFLLTLLAGWINRRQLEVIEYLKEENQFLKDRLGGRRLRVTDAERRGLARRAHALGRKALSGRPRTIQVIVQLILRMALENRPSRYTRIQGALANLGHDVGRGTIANVLNKHGIDPAPELGKHTRHVDGIFRQYAVSPNQAWSRRHAKLQRRSSAS